MAQSLGLGVRASLSAYRVRTTALIDLMTEPLDNTLVYVNDGNPHRRGIEVERSSRAGLEAQLAYAYQPARDDVARALVNSPGASIHRSRPWAAHY